MLLLIIVINETQLKYLAFHSNCLRQPDANLICERTMRRNILTCDRVARPDCLYCGAFCDTCLLALVSM